MQVRHFRQLDNEQMFNVVDRVRKRQRVLHDHIKQGKLFVPPFFGGVTKVEYHDKVFPEIAWIAFVIDYCGFDLAMKCIGEFVCAAKAASRIQQPSFSYVSVYGGIDDEQWVEVMRRLKSKDLYQPLCSALTAYLRCYPEGNVLARLLLVNGQAIGSAENADKQRASLIIGRYLDKRSRYGLTLSAAALRADMLAGVFSMPGNFEVELFSDLERGLKSDKIEALAAISRTHASSVYMAFRELSFLGDEWANYFWKQGLNIAKISTQDVVQEGELPVAKFRELSDRFQLLATKAVGDLSLRVNARHGIDKYTAWVVSALLARQAKIAVKIVGAPSIWVQDIGMILLRSMVECLINLRWILADAGMRSRRFVEYGLGQEKLHIAHLESALGDEVNPVVKQQLLSVIERRRAWLNGHQFDFLTTVNVGGWESETVFGMATKLGCLDLYNHAYNPMSAATHSSWHCVGLHNLCQSEDPVHFSVRLPLVDSGEIHLDVPINAAKYFGIMLVDVASTLGVESPDGIFDSEDWMRQELAGLATSICHGE